MLSKYKYHLVLLLSAFCYSTATTFAKFVADEKITLFNQTFWRFTIAAVFTLLVLKLYYKNTSLKINLKEFKLLSVNSIIFLTTLTATAFSIYLGTPPLKVVVLLFLFPIPAIPLSYLFFKEKPTTKSLISTIISLVSLFIFIEIWTVGSLANIQKGELIAIGNAVMSAILILYGKKIAIETGMHPFKQLFYTLTFGLLILIPISFLLNSFNLNLLEPNIIATYSLKGWIGLLVVGILGASLSNALLYYAAPKVNSMTINVLLLTEPVWVALTSFILFAQIPTSWNIVGMIGIMYAVYLSSKK